MQEVQADHHPSTGPTEPDQTTGLLPGPDGVGLLIRGRRLARLDAATYEIQEGLEATTPAGPVVYDLASSERLFWDLVPSLLILQGGTVVQVLEPQHFILLRGLPVPVTDPRPGMTGVRIASIRRAPVLPPHLLFEALASQGS